MADLVLSLPEYRLAKAISIFLSMPGREVDTNGLVCQALKDEKAVFVPYIHKSDDDQSRVIDMLELRSPEDLAGLDRDAWGIPSITADSVPERQNAIGGHGVASMLDAMDKDTRPCLDLMLMPGLAFDCSGRRLGHGKGFYDRYLSRYKACTQRAFGRSVMPALGRFIIFVSSAC